MLRSARWYLSAEVSGQPIGPIFKGQAIQEESTPRLKPEISQVTLRVTSPEILSATYNNETA